MTNESKETGGPAFPGKQKALMIQAEHREIASQYEIEHNGMTLRDYFAAKAMQSILRGYDVVSSFEDEEVNDPEGMPKLIAKDAYIMADAMLKARKK